MSSTIEDTDMEKAMIRVDNDCLSLLSDHQKEGVLSHDIMMLEDWIGRCESRTIALQVLDNILEDVFKNSKIHSQEQYPEKALRPPIDLSRSQTSKGSLSQKVRIQSFLEQKLLKSGLKLKKKKMEHSR